MTPDVSRETSPLDGVLDTVILGDSRDILRTLPDACVDAVITDPPAGISFMNMAFDSDRGGRDAWIAWLAEIMRECLRVLKPGGHAVVWSLPRTSHWTGMALEDAGFEIRDEVSHLFGCLSDDSEILTEDGWEPYHKCVEGKRILAYNVDNSSFQWQPIEELYLYAYRDTAYRLHSDHTDQLVSRNHRCLVEQGGGYVFRQAETLEREARVPILEDLPGLLAALSMRNNETSREQDLLTRVRKEGCQRTTSSRAQTRSSMPAMWAYLSSKKPDSAGKGSFLFEGVLRGVAGIRSFYSSAIKNHCWAGPFLLDREERSILSCQNERGQQSGLEGRRHVLQDAWQLCRRQVRALSNDLCGHGPQGRLCHGASPVGGSGSWPTFATDRGGTPHRPRSSQQCLEQSPPLQQQPGPQTVRGAGHTRSDLVSVEPVPYDGIVWCVRVASGAFVARRNGTAFVTGNSGFPKSVDIAKAVDRAGGVSPHEQARALKQAREQAGLSRDDLAARVGCTPSSIRDWEEGRARARGHPVEWLVPSPEYRHKLSTILGYPADERAIAGQTHARRDDGSVYGLGHSGTLYGQPVTTHAQEWAGWGTALKPAHEIWWLARKPLSEGTIAANVLAHGTGALNIAATRVAGTPEPTRFDPTKHSHDGWRMNMNGAATAERAATAGGRWPPNTLLSHHPDCQPAGVRRVRGDHKSTRGASTRIYGGGNGYTAATGEQVGYADADGYETVDAWRCAENCPIRLLDEQAGPRTSGKMKAGTQRANRSGYSGPMPEQTGMETYGDAGTVSRFYPTFPGPDPEEAVPFRYQSKASRRDRGEGNTHPTCKSTDLMRWLCRLVTPQGGIILDCFGGSASTAVAAIREGFHFVLVEQDEEYCRIARQRIAAARGERA